MNNELIESTPEAWESGLLGASDDHVAIAPDHVAEEVDRILGIKTISVRLPTHIIEYYTELAKINNVPLEVMIRVVLTTYVDTYAE